MTYPLLSYSIIAHDLDGHLITTRSGSPYLLDNSDWQLNEPVIARYQELYSLGMSQPVCTNQSGYSWRVASLDVKYPTAWELGERLQTMYETIGGPDAWYVSLADPRIADAFKHGKGAKPTADAAEHAKKSPEQYIFDLALAAIGHHIDPSYPIHLSIDLEWRKPKPGMLLEVIKKAGLASPDQMLFVGDREEDKKAAQAAGCHFLFSHEFVRHQLQ